jgi:glucodextranase-like protein/PASTA domain-containing protein
VRRPALLLVVLALSACGADARPATTPRVQLKLSSPGDGRLLRAESVEVSGTVVPSGAQVRVAGAEAQVQGGSFTATVALQPGGNVIDVTAFAAGRRPAADALRVVRDMRVVLPVLAGHDRDEALARLKGLGLDPREQRGDSWIDRLIPGPDEVCSLKPPAGTLVQPQSRVTVIVARTC